MHHHWLGLLNKLLKVKPLFGLNLDSEVQQQMFHWPQEFDHLILQRYMTQSLHPHQTQHSVIGHLHRLEPMHSESVLN